MKKIAVLFSGIFIFIMAFTAGSSYAATSDFGDKALLFGKSIKGFNGILTKDVTDGNDATFQDILNLDNSYNIKDDLSPSQFVSRAYLRLKPKYGPHPNTISVELTFVDGTTETKTVELYNTGDYEDFYITFDKRNVMVKSFRVYATPPVFLYEFDLERGDFNPVDPNDFVIKNLESVEVSAGTITLNWDAITSEYFKDYRIYQGERLLETQVSNSYTVTGLKAGQSYTFKVVGVDQFDNAYAESTVVYTMPEPDTTPPGSPTNLNVVPDRYSALVTWTAPKDDDVNGYYIYLGDNKLNGSPLANTEYTLTGLKIDTEYKVSVYAVDTSGNQSLNPVAKTFKTLDVESVPADVTNLSGNPFNGGASLSWSPSQGATEYKVYKNGTFLIKTKSTGIKLKDLTNGELVSFYVVASNSVGDSKPSNTVTVTPMVGMVPDITLGYGLKDVASGTSYWFSSIWMILAFCIAIPLSFYIGNRVKGLFVA